MENRIEDLKIIYDKENKQYVKAFVTIDGNKEIVTDSNEIKQLVTDLKEQKGVRSLKEIPNDYALAFVTNEKAISNFESQYADMVDIEDSIVNPYDNCATKGINRNNLKKAAMAVGGAVLISAIAFTGCKLMKSNAKDSEITLEQDVLEKKLEKVDPTSWENYVETYEESMQKTFLTSKMDDITSNIVDMEINGKDYQLALAPEEIVALNYYYNTFEMTNEDMLQTYGMYNLDSSKDSDLSNVVHNGLNKIRISLVKAKSKEDVINFNFADEEVQKLYEKYTNLMIEYNTSDNKKEIKSNIEDALKADFIENGSIDINEHPASSVILQLIPSTFNLENSPLSSKLNTILVGVETNFDVDGVKDSIEQNGLVDDACAPIDERLEKFDEYRQTLENDSRIDDRLNKELLTKVNMDKTDNMDQEYYNNTYVESELNTLTENTYDLKETMIPLMNEYLSMEFKLDANIDFEEMNDEIIRAMISELQEQQLNNNRPWDLKTNPSGGKVGDILKGETKKGVPIDESKLTASQKEAAQKEFYESHPDFVTPEKAEQMQHDYSELCVKAWETGQSETINGGPNAPVTDTYANHSEAVVRNAYNDGRNHGIQIYNSVHSNEQITPENNQPDISPDLGEMGGTHQENPNQNGNNQSEPTPQPEPVPTPQPENNESEITPDLGEMGGSHDQNPNQGGSSGSSEIIYDGDQSDIIEGTITTDDTGVDDLSEYGDVASMIDAYINELSNPNSPVNSDVYPNSYKI